MSERETWLLFAVFLVVFVASIAAVVAFPANPPDEVFERMSAGDRALVQECRSQTDWGLEGCVDEVLRHGRTW